MKLFLYLISIFWIIIGLTALINPLKLKTLYTSIVKPVKALFILPLIAGLLLLWAQGASRLVKRQLFFRPPCLMVFVA